MSTVVSPLAICPFGSFAFCLLSMVWHVLQAESVAIQLRGIQLHAHRGKRTAADANLADALNLREPLLR